MIDVNWDLAPEGATEIAGVDGELRWATSNTTYYYSSVSEEWRWVSRGCTWKTIATRPTQKTVADAVEWAKSEWIPSNCDAIAYNPESGKFHHYKYSEGINDKWLHCCFREEFEAYVKEQEGEKWTHTYNGDTCRIIHRVDDDVWIKFKSLLGGLVVRAEHLKPIKPTISKAEAWDKICEGLGEDEIRDTYNIT